MLTAARFQIMLKSTSCRVGVCANAFIRGTECEFVGPLTVQHVCPAAGDLYARVVTNATLMIASAQ